MWQREREKRVRENRPENENEQNRLEQIEKEYTKRVSQLELF